MIMLAPSRTGPSLLDQLRGRFARWLAPEIFALMDQTSAATAQTAAPLPQSEGPPEHWLRMVRERAPQLLQAEQEDGLTYRTLPSLPPQTTVRVAAPARLRPAAPPPAPRKDRAQGSLLVRPTPPLLHSSAPPAQASAAVVSSSVHLSPSPNATPNTDPDAAPPSQPPDTTGAVLAGTAREPGSPQVKEKTSRPPSKPTTLSPAPKAEQQASPLLMWLGKMPLAEPLSASTTEPLLEETWNTGTNGTVEVPNFKAWEQPQVVTTDVEVLRSASARTPQVETLPAAAVVPSRRRSPLNPPAGARPPQQASAQPGSDAASKARWPRLLKLTYHEEDWRTHHERRQRDSLLHGEQNGGD